jgi:hypothetical protein
LNGLIFDSIKDFRRLLEFIKQHLILINNQPKIHLLGLLLTLEMNFMQIVCNLTILEKNNFFETFDHSRTKSNIGPRELKFLLVS